jgi:hypothetical protein
MDDIIVNEVHTEAELVLNPIVNGYILDKLRSEGKEKILKVFGADDVVVINHDELYNDMASYANPCYDYSKRIREVSNFRYIRSDSEMVPKEYVKKVLEKSYNPRERFLVPFDYIMITREDGSQFLISENFSSYSLPNKLHKYSIIRYNGPKEPYKEDFIYSEGIDLSRILSSDSDYIDVLANKFLSAKRLNESLDTVYSVLDKENSDETDHGGSYVGFIDSKDLTIKKTMEKSELLSFEKLIEKGVVRA